MPLATDLVLDTNPTIEKPPIDGVYSRVLSDDAELVTRRKKLDASLREGHLSPNAPYGHAEVGRICMAKASVDSRKRLLAKELIETGDYDRRGSRIVNLEQSASVAALYFSNLGFQITEQAEAENFARRLSPQILNELLSSKIERRRSEFNGLELDLLFPEESINDMDEQVINGIIKRNFNTFFKDFVKAGSTPSIRLQLIDPRFLVRAYCPDHRPFAYSRLGKNGETFLSHGDFARIINHETTHAMLYELFGYPVSDELIEGITTILDEYWFPENKVSKSMAKHYGLEVTRNLAKSQKPKGLDILTVDDIYAKAEYPMVARNEYLYRNGYVLFRSVIEYLTEQGETTEAAIKKCVEIYGSTCQRNFRGRSSVRSILSKSIVKDGSLAKGRNNRELLRAALIKSGINPDDTRFKRIYHSKLQSSSNKPLPNRHH